MTLVGRSVSRGGWTVFFYLDRANVGLGLINKPLKNKKNNNNPAQVRKL